MDHRILEAAGLGGWFIYSLPPQGAYYYYMYIIHSHCYVYTFMLYLYSYHTVYTYQTT